MSIKVSMSEKKLLKHIQMGGEACDNVGYSLARIVINTALTVPAVRRVADTYGFSPLELCLFYVGGIEALMPNPVINAGGPLLAPTFLFMNPGNLHDALAVVASRIEPTDSTEERHTKLALGGGEFSTYVYDVYQQQFGEYPFHRVNAGGLSPAQAANSGCLVLLLVLPLAIFTAVVSAV